MTTNILEVGDYKQIKQMIHRTDTVKKVQTELIKTVTSSVADFAH
jgi:hypothetical protein